MSHDVFMAAALDEARLAREAGEVPIGAVLVVDGRVVSRAFNQPIRALDPTAHAEVLVLRAAAKALGNYRLTEASVYVTIEPCLMCVGALLHARVRDVVYGAPEPKFGALVSAMRALDAPALTHRFAVTGGVLEDECRDLMQQFFREKRQAERDAELAGQNPPTV